MVGLFLNILQEINTKNIYIFMKREHTVQRYSPFLFNRKKKYCMKKEEARTMYKEKRQALKEAEMEKMNDLMLIQFQSCELPFIDCLFTYWPIEENNEPSTHLFTEFLRFRNPGMQVLYPKSDFDKSIMHAVLTDI